MAHARLHIGLFNYIMGEWHEILDNNSVTMVPIRVCAAIIGSEKSSGLPCTRWGRRHPKAGYRQLPMM